MQIFNRIGFGCCALYYRYARPNRTLLGLNQRAWSGAQQLASSKATWQVLGQQVLMSKMLVPAEMLQVLSAISSGAVTPDVLAQVNQLIKELVEIKLRYLNHDPSLTVEQCLSIKTVVPYNLDAWDGYAVEGRRCTAHCSI